MDRVCKRANESSIKKEEEKPRLLYLCCTIKRKTPVNTEVLSFCSDSGRIQTCNRWSRNPVRYSVAPRSLY